VVRNQIDAVPKQIAWQLQYYLFRRRDTLHQIEQRDLDQLHHPAHP